MADEPIETGLPGRSGPEPVRPPRGSREVELGSLTEMGADAWRSFDHPRPQEPRLDAGLEQRLAGPLPEQGTDAAEVFADAAEILDRSISPAQPLYLGYIGSTGLKEGVMGAALAVRTQPEDVDLVLETLRALGAELKELGA